MEKWYPEGYVFSVVINNHEIPLITLIPITIDLNSLENINKAISINQIGFYNRSVLSEILRKIYKHLPLWLKEKLHKYLVY
jgi:hypothetical protein